MAVKVFISFRFSDGFELKEDLIELFGTSKEVINRSENEDRSNLSEDTIQSYLYDKLRDTSVTIVLLTPNAISYNKNENNEYDDWLYDELRFSLEDRENNRTNGIIAVYTDESEPLVIKKSTHTCSVCGKNKQSTELLNIDNLIRKNMLNIKKEYKFNKCIGLYDGTKDSYISLVHIDEFKNNWEKYIESAIEKRNRKNEFNLIKRM